MKTASIRPWRRGATHQASRRSVAAKPLGRTSAGTATIATLPLSSAACEHSERARAAQVRATTAPWGRDFVIDPFFFLDAEHLHRLTVYLHGLHGRSFRQPRPGGARPVGTSQRDG